MQITQTRQQVALHISKNMDSDLGRIPMKLSIHNVNVTLNVGDALPLCLNPPIDLWEFPFKAATRVSESPGHADERPGTPGENE